MASIYDVFRIESNGQAVWLGAADTLADARSLMQRDMHLSCRYLILDSYTGEEQFVVDVRKAS